MCSWVYFLVYQLRESIHVLLSLLLQLLANTIFNSSTINYENKTCCLLAAGVHSLCGNHGPVPALQGGPDEKIKFKGPSTNS